MADLIIRKSEAKDWQIIQKLNTEVYDNSSRFDQYLIPDDNLSESSISNFKDDVSNPNKFCMIAELNNIPVGYLVGGENNLSWRSNKRGEIFHMGVSPEYRSQGIGSLLVKEFVSWCKSRGLTHLAATTYFADTKARHFYEKQGLLPIDITLEGPIK